MQLLASLALAVLATLAAAPALAAPSGNAFGHQLADLKDGGAHAPNGQGHGFGLLLVKGERDDSRDAVASAVSEAVAAPAEAIAALFSSSAGDHASKGRPATGAAGGADVHAALGAAVDGLPPVSAAPATAMPEPTGALLFGAGSGIVALRLRRRAKVRRES